MNIFGVYYFWYELFLFFSINELTIGHGECTRFSVSFSHSRRHVNKIYAEKTNNNNMGHETQNIYYIYIQIQMAGVPLANCSNYKLYARLAYFIQTHQLRLIYGTFFPSYANNRSIWADLRSMNYVWRLWGQFFRGVIEFGIFCCLFLYDFFWQDFMIIYLFLSKVQQILE